MIADDVGLEESSLPEGFHAKFPGHKREPDTQKYTVYGLLLCRCLALSMQRNEALINAETLSGIVVSLYYLVKHPEIDVAGPFAKKRENIPDWMCYLPLLNMDWNSHWGRIA
jgi:hypothetical protein